jgi:hypothetical protein
MIRRVPPSFHIKSDLERLEFFENTTLLEAFKPLRTRGNFLHINHDRKFHDKK